MKNQNTVTDRSQLKKCEGWNCDEPAADHGDGLCFYCHQLELNRRFRQHNRTGEYAPDVTDR
jgi:hypothetical protein